METRGGRGDIIYILDLFMRNDIDKTIHIDLQHDLFTFIHIFE